MQAFIEYLSNLPHELGATIVISLVIIYCIHLTVLFYLKGRDRGTDLQLKIIDMVSSGLDDVHKLRVEVEDASSRISDLESRLRIIQSDVFSIASTVGSWANKYPPTKESIKIVRDKLMHISNKGDD